MIVLASVLLIGGYLSNYKPVFIACVLPLLIAAGLTYRMKYLQKQLDGIGMETGGNEDA